MDVYYVFLRLYIIIFLVILCYCFYRLIIRIINQLKAERKLATLLSNDNEFWKIVENENDSFEIAVFIKRNRFKLLNRNEQNLIEEGMFQSSIKGRSLYMDKLIDLANKCKSSGK